MNLGLLLIDIQNDFISGSLKVPKAEEIFIELEQYFQNPDLKYVVATKDFHPKNHCSFKLWPEHCVANTFGSELHEQLKTHNIDLIINKGINPQQDSYSAFFENDGVTSTGLLEKINNLKIDQWILAGLATDFCVKATALDALKLNLNIVVDLKACRAVDPNFKATEVFTELKIPFIF